MPLPTALAEVWEQTDKDLLSIQSLNQPLTMKRNHVNAPVKSKIMF